MDTVLALLCAAREAAEPVLALSPFIKFRLLFWGDELGVLWDDGTGALWDDGTVVDWD